MLSVTGDLDEDELLQRIAGGESQAEIAAALGIGAATLNRWLHSTPERSARARSAMAMSAETWLDRGLDALATAPPDAVEIARARAIEQHCARRAAIRDPARYGNRTTLAGDAESPLTVTVQRLTGEGKA